MEEVLMKWVYVCLYAEESSNCMRKWIDNIKDTQFIYDLRIDFGVFPYG